MLDGMTRMKIRVLENRKIFMSFRDMVEFFTGNRDPIPPSWAPKKRARDCFSYSRGQ